MKRRVPKDERGVLDDALGGRGGSLHNWTMLGEGRARCWGRGLQKEQLWGGNWEGRRDEDREDAGAPVGVPVARRQAGGPGARQEESQWGGCIQSASTIGCVQGATHRLGPSTTQDRDMKSDDLITAHAAGQLWPMCQGTGRAEPHLDLSPAGGTLATLHSRHEVPSSLAAKPREVRSFGGSSNMAATLGLPQAGAPARPQRPRRGILAEQQLINATQGTKSKLRQGHPPPLAPGVPYFQIPQPQASSCCPSPLASLTTDQIQF